MHYSMIQTWQELTLLPHILQTLYVFSGCDYTSFFSQLGKATFLRYFFQYASFITAGDQPNTPGTLASTALNGECNTGFLAFIRLVGTVYYKEHASGFESTSPVTHFIKFTDPGLTVLDQHFSWLEDFRQNISDRIKLKMR